jgi:hypothetical protein
MTTIGGLWTCASGPQGILDFPSIIKAIEDAGYDDDWWPMDLCFWPNALEATEPAKKYMDDLVANYG